MQCEHNAAPDLLSIETIYSLSVISREHVLNCVTRPLGNKGVVSQQFNLSYLIMTGLNLVMAA